MIKEIYKKIFGIIDNNIPYTARKPLKKIYPAVDKLFRILPLNHKIKMKINSKFTYLYFPDKVKLKFPINQDLADFENILNYLNKHKISKGENIIDAGAYLGVFALYAGKKVGSAGKVIAFEPNPKIYEHLCGNISLNGLDNIVIPVKKGLWSIKGVKEFYVSDAVSSVFANQKNPEEKIKIDVATLDEALDELNIGKIDFIKMDIEGAEIEAVKGMQKILENSNCELAIASYHKIDGNKTYLKLEEMLKEKSYCCSTPNSEHLTTFAHKAVPS